MISEQLQPNLFDGIVHLMTNTLCYIAEFISENIISLLYHVYAYFIYIVLNFPRPPHSPRTRRTKKSVFKIPEPEFDPKMLKRRGYAIDEIVSSEYSYQKQMEILMEVYQPLLSRYMIERQMDKFFSPLIKLIAGSKMSVKQFEDEVAKGPKKAEFGNLFAKKLNLVPMFIPYISNYLDFSYTIYQLNINDKNFANELDNLELTNPPLTSLLVAPVQRMPKYVLLLKEVLKGTPEWHSDYKQIQEAIEKLKREAQIADKSISEATRRAQLLDLERNIRNCPKLFEEGRTFLGRFQPTKNNTDLYLLSDLIIITKEKKELLSSNRYSEVNQIIELKKVQSSSVNDDVVILKTTGNDIKLHLAYDAKKLSDLIENQIKELLNTQENK